MKMRNQPLSRTGHVPPRESAQYRLALLVGIVMNHAVAEIREGEIRQLFQRMLLRVVRNDEIPALSPVIRAGLISQYQILGDLEVIIQLDRQVRTAEKVPVSPESFDMLLNRLEPMLGLSDNKMVLVHPLTPKQIVDLTRSAVRELHQ